MPVSTIQRIIHQLIICKIRSQFTTLLPVNLLENDELCFIVSTFCFGLYRFVWKKLDKNISEKDLEETEARLLNILRFNNFTILKCTPKKLYNLSVCQL
jgi:hypothetical protein